MGPLGASMRVKQAATARDIVEMQATARAQNKHNHLYMALRMSPVQVTAFTLDEDNSLATANAIADVERVLEQSEFKTKELRVCISSTSAEALEEGLRRHGADVMVYCGLGSEHYDVRLGSRRLP